MAKDTFKWIKTTKHNGAVHMNKFTQRLWTRLNKQNGLLPAEKQSKIEEVEMTEEEARKVPPVDKTHVPVTRDDVAGFVKTIDEKDEEIAELKRQLANATNNGGAGSKKKKASA